MKKSIVGSVDWVLYKVLSTKQKQRLSNILTQEQKQYLKKIIKPGKKQAQLRKVERLKYRLYNLGFFDKALEDLNSLYVNAEDSYLKRLAAWELALWHANKYTEEDATLCLKYIQAATENVKDEETLRRAVIIQAECYDLLAMQDEGKRIVSAALSRKQHPDLFLAAANLEKSPSDRVSHINKALAFYGTSPIALKHEAKGSAYDALSVDESNTSTTGIDITQPKVSIIIPAYNAEDIIQTSIESMLKQTWTNIEILVANDYSTDDTASVVEEYTKIDSRVRLVNTNKNGGAYVARNHALKLATGDFVTINDADDWSHPTKIETQVLHLIENEKIIANFSQQARSTEELKFYRRGKPGQYIFTNMSSFMFRKKPVMEKVGYWDCVRFAGDSEFLKRVKIAFGEKSVVELQTAPLSFQRQSATSLTAHSAFGFPGYFMGVRKEYAEAHESYHKENKQNLYYAFPQERPFAVPEPMWPTREEKPNGRRHFDVLIGSEFRLLGGTNMSNLEEIKAQKRLGLKTGLVQLSRYDLNSVDSINPRIRELINGENVQIVNYGEKVSCDVLILRHPPILQEWQKYIPDIEAKHVIVIVNQPPKRDYSEGGQTLYTLPDCVENLQEYFGQSAKWYPIGPLVREALVTHHSEELESIELAKENWVNIIDVNEWRRDSRPKKSASEPIKVGRHSRSQYVKWPNTKQSLLEIYPDKPEYEIHVLGGADIPQKLLDGKLPSNWKVHEFGDMHPREFLSGLDVFVYYTHPDWIEAFGRVIFEAMAVGVPVIIPPNYQYLFGEAAIYAQPDQVQEKIEQLMNDEKLYDEQVNKALHYVEQHFGYSKHSSRLEEFLHEQSRNGQ